MQAGAHSAEHGGPTLCLWYKSGLHTVQAAITHTMDWVLLNNTQAFLTALEAEVQDRGVSRSCVW